MKRVYENNYQSHLLAPTQIEDYDNDRIADLIVKLSASMSVSARARRLRFFNPEQN